MPLRSSCCDAPVEKKKDTLLPTKEMYYCTKCKKKCLPLVDMGVPMGDQLKEERERG